MAVASVFLIGGLVTVFAIIRITVPNQVSIHPEISWLNLWNEIECSIAVSVCGLMVFKQLLNRRRMGYRENGYGSSGNTATSSVASSARSMDRKEPVRRETSSPTALLEPASQDDQPVSDNIALGTFTFVDGGRPVIEGSDFETARAVRLQRRPTYVQEYGVTVRRWDG
jgi:hypothetical protein